MAFWPATRTTKTVTQKRIVLIIGGGIAAYKCLDLIRRLKERAIAVRVVLTRAGEQFVTPLSVGALSNEPVFTNLFDLNGEREIGHIRLSREADLIVVAPATADLLAKMAGGHADDLASTVLMATDKPVIVAPAMNPRMWLHPATQRNVAQLKADGITVIDPAVGEMAERGEAGPGRLPEVPELLARIVTALGMGGPAPATSNLDMQSGQGALSGRHVLVTSGPTHEPIDPVRYIANRSSGKQGHAIAAAAARAGARVTLICGPVNIADPAGVETVHVETAAEMLDAAHRALPADVGIFAAAVADWRVASAENHKIKKKAGTTAPTLLLAENPDILKTIAANGPQRPGLIVGFAAETDNVTAYGASKLKTKNADWILANDVSEKTGIMGGDHNRIHLVSAKGVEDWPQMSKEAVAEALVARIAAHLGARKDAAQ
ncbi:MAG TPA: bifunctional phosphopantothenoylcysteine decarboxylase/phosphopantothenate--cysteine ligase CoaBC [Hyphomicrobiaceae bacterium]|nr:bifunctional phosphopantothenoylcysteine decarboxylase/phosphopantothenate--cysteine ligase CoaBC [Hyphomicrobiaceae bacterium]